MADMKEKNYKLCIRLKATALLSSCPFLIFRLEFHTSCCDIKMSSRRFPSFSYFFEMQENLKTMKTGG